MWTTRIHHMSLVTSVLQPLFVCNTSRAAMLAEPGGPGVNIWGCLKRDYRGNVGLNPLFYSRRLIPPQLRERAKKRKEFLAGACCSDGRLATPIIWPSGQNWDLKCLFYHQVLCPSNLLHQRRDPPPTLLPSPINTSNRWPSWAGLKSIKSLQRVEWLCLLQPGVFKMVEIGTKAIKKAVPNVLFLTQKRNPLALSAYVLLEQVWTCTFAFQPQRKRQALM